MSNTKIGLYHRAARPVSQSYLTPTGNATGECLDRLILVGMGSLQRALRIYRDFFNGHRPHQEIDNQIPERRAIEMSWDCAGAMTNGDLAVGCGQFLGGMLNSYYRKAA